jgi:diguanylate cyclase (GGDEF)-like protein/PAS domain S-box-containing protein
MLVLGGSVFAADLLLPLTVAVPVLYVLPVMLSLWLADARTTRQAALLCTLAVVGGVFVTPAAGPLWQGLVNRAVAVFAIWSAQALGRMRIEVERALWESRETTATTLASIAEGVITTGPDGRVTYVNPSGERILGWRAPEVRGRLLAELLPGRSPEADLPGSDLLPASGELSAKRGDGNGLLLEASSALIPDKSRPGGVFGRVLVFRDVTERRAREAAVQALAYRDPLTGLANRASFEDRLELELCHAQRSGKKLALLYLDLDGFKAINDRHGHAAGDEILCGVARRLRAVLRAEDTLARLGGDEFTALVGGLASAGDAELVAEKIVAALAPAHAVRGAALCARPSVGLALYPDDVRAAEPRGAELGERLLEAADRAMYAAKEAGGGRWWRAAAGEALAAPERAG